MAYDVNQIATTSAARPPQPDTVTLPCDYRLSTWPLKEKQNQKAFNLTTCLSA